jgi:hypothetical protein
LRASGRDERTERHRAAVRRSLTSADEAARDGDYEGALAWLATIEAVTDDLPPGVESRRKTWMSHMQSRRATA